MLKNLFKKSNKQKTDKMSKILDGYVDIKIFDCKDKNNKKLIYHDTGDNTVTIWMKHVILQLLAGNNTSSYGKNIYGKKSINNVTATFDHSSTTNSDGSCFSETSENGQFFPSPVTSKALGSSTSFSLLPTKVLFGTGKEYTDWTSLQNENETKNPTWYQNLANVFGTDGANFNASNYGNDYSATISTQGHYSVTTTSIPNGVVNAVTVEDPDGSKLSTMPSDMARRIGVIGAIKTPVSSNGGDITSSDLNSYLNGSVSDSGKLLQEKYKGVGYPCFLYFNRYTNDEFNSINSSSSSVYVNKEDTNDFVCNKLTFKITLPSQDSTSDYYPYNGYTLKQIGLFNDAILTDGTSDSTITNIGANLMPHGTLLAVKDLAPFTKTATSEVTLTWTLTI